MLVLILEVSHWIVHNSWYCEKNDRDVSTTLYSGISDLSLVKCSVYMGTTVLHSVSVLD